MHTGLTYQTARSNKRSILLSFYYNPFNCQCVSNGLPPESVPTLYRFDNPICQQQWQKNMVGVLKVITQKL